MIRIAIDAMGGDYAPVEVVRGTLDSAAAFPDVAHILVGQEDKIRGALGGAALPSNVQIEHAPEVIGMAEHPVEALRRKKKSSIVRCAKLVRDGQADALVSAGNTGAVVAATRVLLGPLEGVKRAGIAVPIPTERGMSVIIDVGANISCKPIHLLQYGVMGVLYSQYVFHTNSRPSVGLLNIGEENVKGTYFSQLTYQSFQKTSLNFVGNIEGHEIFSGKCDVVVCEGFVGNAILKMVEGLIAFLLKQVQKESGADEKTQRGLMKFASTLDYSEYGGAPLLGVRGVVIISHGRSRARAITNAVKLAHNLTQNKINEHIVTEMKKISWWGRLHDWFTSKGEKETGE